MRFLAGLVVVLLATQAFGQPRVGDVVVRGCLRFDLQGLLVLSALDPSRQAFNSQNWVTEGQLFSLIADGTTLNQLVSFEGDEVEVEGHLNPDNPIREVPGPILEPPIAGGIPGLSGQQMPRSPERVLSRRPADHDEIEITAHKFLRARCRSTIDTSRPPTIGRRASIVKSWVEELTRLVPTE